MLGRVYLRGSGEQAICMSSIFLEHAVDVIEIAALTLSMRRKAERVAYRRTVGPALVCFCLAGDAVSKALACLILLLFLL